MIVFCNVLLLSLALLESEGAQPPGLKSLRQCNKYHNLNISDKDFSPLTKQEIEELNKGELDHARFGIVVYGGVNALKDQLPFMAVLGYKDGSRKVYPCGGTLISELFILTAAHCFLSKRIEFVRLGDLNLTSSADDVESQEFQVVDVFVHPNYKVPQKYNDIALIKLHRPAIFTSSVSPACLEPKRVDIRLNDFYVAGWGALDFGEGTTAHLQVAELELSSTGNCQNAFPRSNLDVPESIKPDSQVCAIGKGTNLTDTCQGDSGGPLAYKFETSPKTFVYMIAGITSFGKPCALGKFPGVYTRVSHYTDWIENIVWPDDKLETSEVAIKTSEVAIETSEVANNKKIYFPCNRFNIFQ